MSKTNDGRQAIPDHPDARSNMTLRDYFAAKAMESFLTHEHGADAPCDIVAVWAYDQADAMLQARRQ